MRRISMLIAVVCFAVACAAPTPEQLPEASGLDESDHPLATVVSPRLTTQPGPLEDDSRPDGSADQWREQPGTRPPADTTETVATQAIVQLFEDEGLFVLDIDTASEQTEGPRTMIRTSVLYGTGRSHPREASYLLEVESIAGIWTVVSIEPP